jgi:hypothetical protein
MLKHIVLIKLNPDAPAGASSQIMAALRGLPAEIPEILALDVGKNVVESDRNLDIGLVVEFADRAALDRYAAHPAHVAVVKDHIQPAAQRLVVVDFES